MRQAQYNGTCWSKRLWLQSIKSIHHHMRKHIWPIITKPSWTHNWVMHLLLYLYISQYDMEKHVCHTTLKDLLQGTKILNQILPCFLLWLCSSAPSTTKPKLSSLLQTLTSCPQLLKSMNVTTVSFLQKYLYSTSKKAGLPFQPQTLGAALIFST